MQKTATNASILHSKFM